MPVIDSEESEQLQDRRNAESEDSSLSSRLGFTVRVLIGLTEDLPVMILLYYSVVARFCGVPAKQERYSSITVATIVSSMLNSMWTMFILYWDLFGCNKKISDAHCCCTVIRSMYEQTSMLVCYCGFCGCVTNSNCKCVCLAVHKPLPLSPASPYNRCKRMSLRIGKSVLFGFIFLLYLGIFTLSAMTLSNAYHKPVLDKAIIQESEVTRAVIADEIGPGLDARPDAAMFITMVYELPNWYHVGLYDNRNVNVANSASVYQIQNRLYIGQFNELEHLKDGTLTKVIPCIRVFPYLDKIDESLFQWNYLQKLNFTDFSSCKLIFRLRYHPTNNDWNPFINFVHKFFKYITVEWGIYIKDNETCPTGFQPPPVSSLLTDTVKQDIVNYTCSPSCINATDACREASYGKFEETQFRRRLVGITRQPKFYLTVNDQLTVDFCNFITIFHPILKFCDKFWADFQPVKVPEYIKQAYPKFITIPMTYKEKETTHYLFLDSKCSKLWAEGEKLSF